MEHARWCEASKLQRVRERERARLDCSQLDDGILRRRLYFCFDRVVVVVVVWIAWRPKHAPNTRVIGTHETLSLQTSIGGGVIGAQGATPKALSKLLAAPFRRSSIRIPKRPTCISSLILVTGLKRPLFDWPDIQRGQLPLAAKGAKGLIGRRIAAKSPTRTRAS